MIKILNISKGNFEIILFSTLLMIQGFVIIYIYHIEGLRVNVCKNYEDTKERTIYYTKKISVYYDIRYTPIENIYFYIIF